MTLNVIKAIKDAQKNLGLNQATIAARLDLSSATISKILNDQQPITVNIAVRLEKAGIGTVKEVLLYQYEKDCAKAKKLKTAVKKDCLK